MEISYTAYLEGSLALDADGSWHHNGVIFQNERLADLFHRSICFDEKLKKYVVRIGAQQATFTVADVPYFVKRFDLQSLEVELNDGTKEKLALDSLTMGKNSAIYCTVHNNERAKFCRAAHQHLVTLACSETTLLIQGKEIPLRHE